MRHLLRRTRAQRGGAEGSVRITAVHDVFVPENSTRNVGRATPGMEGVQGIHKRHLMVKLQARPPTRAENRKRLVDFFVKHNVPHGDKGTDRAR